MSYSFADGRRRRVDAPGREIMAHIRAGIVAVVVTFALAPQGDAPARPEAVVDNSEFMDLFLKSSYGELQQAMAKPPVDRKEWAAIYQKAIRLAEMQNLLFFRNRDEVKDPRWAVHAADGRQSAADLAAAALLGLRNLQKADFAGVRQKYVAVAEACNACHKTFARDAPTIKP
jgi:cytochrome c556